MSLEEKKDINLKYWVELAKTILQILVIMVAVFAAYFSLEKRISLVEAQMNNKVDKTFLLEYMDNFKKEFKKDLVEAIKKEILINNNKGSK